MMANSGSDMAAVGNNRIGNLLYQQLYGVTGQYAFNHSILPGFAPICTFQS